MPCSLTLTLLTCAWTAPPSVHEAAIAQACVPGILTYHEGVSVDDPGPAGDRDLLSAAEDVLQPTEQEQTPEDEEQDCQWQRNAGTCWCSACAKRTGKHLNNLFKTEEFRSISEVVSLTLLSESQAGDTHLRRSSVQLLHSIVSRKDSF